MSIGLNLLAVVIIISSGAVLFILTRRIQSGNEVGLRPLASYDALKSQVGRAVESGRSLHFALGRASLAETNGATSIAALTALDYLAQDGCPSGVPPLVTVGEATLLPAAQDQLRGGYEQANRGGEFSPRMAQFLAPASSPFTYAAGASEMIQHAHVGSSLLMGHFGPEIAIMTEAAARQKMDQVIGSDDPVAISIATAMTDHVLIGEEMFAAAAYLEGEPEQIASLQLQDLLRLIIAVSILLAALVNLI